MKLPLVVAIVAPQDDSAYPKPTRYLLDADRVIIGATFGKDGEASDDAELLCEGANALPELRKLRQQNADFLKVLRLVGRVAGSVTIDQDPLTPEQSAILQITLEVLSVLKRLMAPPSREQLSIPLPGAKFRALCVSGNRSSGSMEVTEEEFQRLCATETGNWKWVREEDFHA